MLAWMKKDSFLAWAITPAVLTVFVLWYQFGFSLGGMLEEWDVLYLIQNHPDFWNSFPGHTLSAEFAARPLQSLPHFLAHQISANSFLGFHMVLMAAVLMRVIGAASLGYFLFGNRAYAAAFGMLSFVFPADTQQFEFRTFHISVAVGMMVWAAACSVRAFRASSPLDRWSSLSAATVLACVAVMIYEPVATLYLIAPVLLFARDGFRSFFAMLRSKLALTAAWCTGPVVNAAYLYYAIAIFRSSYQVSASGGNLSKAFAHNFHYLIDSAAYRVFYDAWVSTWWILATQIVHFKFLTATAVALIVGLVWLSHRQQSHFPTSRCIRYVFAGLIVAAAGYIPFMASEAHMQITQRTFIAVAPGATLLVISVLAYLFQRIAIAGVIAAACVVFAGFVAQMYQFDHYTRDYTNVVRPYTAMLTDRTDQAKRVHLIFDRTGFGGHLNGMYESKVQYGAIVRLRTDIGRSFLCLGNPQSPYLPSADCSLKDGTWTVRRTAGTVDKFQASDVQVIEMGPDFDRSYQSRDKTWHDMGTFNELKSMFVIPAADSYRCTADSMWGYSGFCRGEGWTDGIFYHVLFKHQNWFAAIHPSANLLFSLTPARTDYTFRVNLFGGMDISMADTMRVAVNGHLVSLQKSGPVSYTTDVPAAAMRSGQNVITFDDVLPAGRDLGLPVVSVELTPKK